MSSRTPRADMTADELAQVREREAAWERRTARNRRKRAVRKVSLNPRFIRIRELEAGREVYPEGEYERPRTRAECEHGERPCPFVMCRWNLYLDVSFAGSIVLNFPDIEPDSMRHSCALDVADGDGSTLEHVGEVMNITRERVRQIENDALRKLGRHRVYLPMLRELAGRAA